VAGNGGVGGDFVAYTHLTVLPELVRCLRCSLPTTLFANAPAWEIFWSSA